MRRVVLLGATKGMGRALARRMSQRGDRLFLLGRNLEDLDRSARDLEVRGGRHVAGVGCALCDLERPETFIPALKQASAHLGSFDTVVVTAGLYETQEHLEHDPELVRRVLSVDFTNTIVFCEHARQRLLAQGGGTLCVFSSVAGDRSRKPVVLYGAAKAGLSHYLEGLDYRFRGQGLRTVCVKPGFVNTSMTQGLRKPPFVAEADDVAREVLEAIDRGTPEVYAPRLWAPIMFIVRRMPRWVMRRVKF